MKFQLLIDVEIGKISGKFRFKTQKQMSRAMRKPDFCLRENKGADQLRSNCEADQRLCFRYTDSTIPLLLKYEISSIYPSSEFRKLHRPVCVRPGRKPRRPVFSRRGSNNLSCSQMLKCQQLAFLAHLSRQAHKVSL